jgi:type IV secretory pathway VirB4 component
MVAALAASRMIAEPDAEDVNAIGYAIDEATREAQSQYPTLGGVVRRLLRPTPWMAEQMSTSVEGLATKVRGTAQSLDRLVKGDLAGMFDGQTTVNIDWDGRGVVLDLSAVHGTPALAPVMICVGTWLAQAVARDDHRHRLLVLDELWALLHLVSVTRWLRSLEKLSRKYGLAIWMVMHRLSDLAGSSAAGSEAREQAEGLLKDVETRILYPQDASESDALVKLLGLRESVVNLLTHRLPDHRALWLVGQKAAVVAHVMTAIEFQYAQTDDAMAA